MNTETYSTPTLEELLTLAREDDAGRVTRDMWNTSLRKIKEVHPKKIQCIKIDPMQK